MKAAERGIADLEAKVDTLITIPNERILQIIEKRTPLNEAFAFADDVLRQGIQGISDLITQPGLINLDFADVKTIMTDAGSAMMGIGEGTGEHRAADAAQKAIASPLLETTIEGARGVIFNITGGIDLSMYEVNEAAEMISRAVDSEAQIIFGASIDPAMQGKVRVTVLAAGFGRVRCARGSTPARRTCSSSTKSRRSTWTTSRCRRSCGIVLAGDDRRRIPTRRPRANARSRCGARSIGIPNWASRKSAPPALVERELDELGIEHRRVAKTGVVGVIRGGLPGKTAGLRADMDALPIDEESGEACASEVAGKMHACGHDAHTAMVLGAARELPARRATLHGNVVLLFQPAEEGPGGARR